MAERPLLSPVVSHTRTYDRTYTFSWFDSPFFPEDGTITQAYGICMTEGGRIVLVSHDGNYWNLPGGTLQDREEPEEALRREVREEACSLVLACRYLGSQRVDDPDNPEGLKEYWQTRFWARVEIEEFESRFEIVERRLVTPEEFLSTLTWGDSPIAPILLERALRVERAYRGGRV